MLGILFRLGNLRAEQTAHATAGRNLYGDPNPKEDRGQAIIPPQGARGHPHWSRGEQWVGGRLKAHGLPRVMGKILENKL